MKFRKRPVEIEAVQWDGENFPELREFAGDRVAFDAVGNLQTQTLEGPLRAIIGDWIIKGVAFEVYPCNPGIFARTYGPVGEAESMGGLCGCCGRMVKIGEWLIRAESERAFVCWTCFATMTKQQRARKYAEK